MYSALAARRLTLLEAGCPSCAASGMNLVDKSHQLLNLYAYLRLQTISGLQLKI